MSALDELRGMKDFLIEMFIVGVLAVVCFVVILIVTWQP